MPEPDLLMVDHPIRVLMGKGDCWPDVYLKSQMVRGARPPYRGRSAETDGCPPPLHVCPSSNYKTYSDPTPEIRELCSLLGWCWTGELHPGPASVHEAPEYDPGGCLCH